MTPTLHREYTAAEAIAAFGNDGPIETLCDGQFVLFPGHVLGFLTVEGPPGGAMVSVPISVGWRPGRLNYEPGGDPTWLPTPVREVWGPDRAKLAQLYLFLRTAGDERLVYAGPAHLGTWGNFREEGNAAYFTLETKLPRDVWLRLGGHPGWMVEFNHEEHLLSGEDRATFRQLLDEVARAENAHLSLTRYEGDKLSLHVNPRRGWLSFQRHEGDFGLQARDVEFTGDPNAEEFFLCDCGIDLEFRAETTLSRELALRAAEEFFATGKQPASAPWADETSVPSI